MDYLLNTKIFIKPNRKETQMTQEIFLINFRIPAPIKEQFEERCSYLRTNMTAELNRMIRDFLRETKTQNDEPLAWFTSTIDERSQL
jgi:hypothetical protein